MAKKKMQISDENELKFISDDEAKAFDAQASFMLNPYVRWAKFILTDDQPNGNMERTPVTEFDNIIQSGIHMPIKMGEGRIEEGHEDASPIGVITHLKKEFVDGVNRIIGLAAFWLRERPSDISFIKERIDNNEDVNVSWELGAQDKVLMDDGVYDWRGLAVQAVTVVDRPAYQGRTRIIAMAAKKKTSDDKWGEDYIKNLPDSCFLYIERGGTKDSEGRTSQELRHFPVKDDKGLYVESKLREVLTEAGKTNLPVPILKSIKKTVTTLLDKIDAGASLEEISLGTVTAPLENKDMEEDKVEELLKQKIAELEAALATANASLKEKEDALKLVNEAKAALDTEKVALAAELDELRAFKKDIDDTIAKAEKLDAIKAKFAEASLTKDEAFYTDNAEKLLALDAAGLDFMIQELTVFTKNAEASLNGKKVPNLKGEDTTVDVHEIVKALKERKSK